MTEKINQENRFLFGKNWNRFLKRISEERISSAEQSLKNMLDVDNLEGKRFLDIGSGSGIFSLSAKKLGAEVFSFDYDADSVKCTEYVREKYFKDDGKWRVTRGDILDGNFVSKLGKFDAVYSWGVLHHTGSMYKAIENSAGLVAEKGLFFISIYNNQGWITNYWTCVKRTYNGNKFLRPFIVMYNMPYLFFLRLIFRFVTGRLKQERGMSLWYDMIDWLGGYPFETARPEEIVDFVTRLGFSLKKKKTVGRRQGCNEYVFARN